MPGMPRPRFKAGARAHRSGSCAHALQLQPSTRAGDSLRFGRQRGCAAREPQAPSSDAAAYATRASNAPSPALGVSARQRAVSSFMNACPGLRSRVWNGRAAQCKQLSRRAAQACTVPRALGTAASGARRRCVLARRAPARLRAAARPAAARTPVAERARGAHTAAARWRRRRTARVATQDERLGCAEAAMARCMERRSARGEPLALP